MNIMSNQNQYIGLSRLKLFFALSRTQHGLIDMATPCLCALLWLGEFPSLRIILLGLITTFAGYTAVYALNDVVDYRADKEKLQKTPSNDSGNYLDSVLIRHPMADGSMDLKEGMVWLSAWLIIAVFGAYLLNPMCVLILMGGCVLEISYCLLLRITYLRTIISGVVKTTGAVAAVYAVDPTPSLLPLITVFLWLFFWEIGGQNVPADWTDMEEDRAFQAQTIPVRFGAERAAQIILGAIILTIVINVILLGLLEKGFGLISMSASILTGLYLLLFPALRLFRTKERRHVIDLFNKASFYPLVLLIVVTVNILI